MNLQDQVEIGRQAEEFLRYIAVNDYFNGLIERVKLEYAQRILSLRPDQTAEFTTMKERMDVWDEILGIISGDIASGSEALKELEGGTEQKGLL